MTALVGRSRLLAALPILLPAATALLRDPWWFIGSAAMQMSGVAGVEPNDIDLLCSGADADRLIAAWSEHLDTAYQPPDDDRFRSRFARFRHLPMPLEVMGDLQVRVEGEWRPVLVEASRRIQWNGYAVPVPTLKEQVRILRQFGRAKDMAKADSIASHIETESRNAD